MLPKYVDGAGAQRSDPKSGDPEDFAGGFGPQGDARRINNLVRAVRSFSSAEHSYPVVDTNQITCYNDHTAIAEKNYFWGQDADYLNLSPSYTDNEDGTILDNNTGLIWQQNPGEKMSFDEAFQVCEKTSLAGYTDWRLPNAKELQSIVDYTRSPETTDSPALFPLFSSTEIINEAGQKDFGYYWTSTTHVSSASREEGSSAVYISFGRALGNMAKIQRK